MFSFFISLFLKYFCIFLIHRSSMISHLPFAFVFFSLPLRLISFNFYHVFWMIAKIDHSKTSFFVLYVLSHFFRFFIFFPSFPSRFYLFKRTYGSPWFPSDDRSIFQTFHPLWFGESIDKLLIIERTTNRNTESDNTMLCYLSHYRPYVIDYFWF